jgi:hypothetical protein
MACSKTPEATPIPNAAAPMSIPAASGALGPNLIRSVDGDTVLSWMEPDDNGGHALRYSVWNDGEWTSPLTVASGGDWFVNWADFPSVVPIDKDFWVAHWLRRRPAGGYAYDVYASVSRDGGRNWSPSLLPHRDDTDTEHGFVTLFPNDGTAGLIWLDGRNTGGGHHDDHTAGGMTLRAATLAPDATLSNETELDGLTCDCCQTDVTVTANGPVAVYRDRTRDEIRDIYAARFVDGAWQPGRPVANDGWMIAGCPVNGPVVASHGNDIAVAWFSNANGTPRVRLARSHDATATFATPVDVTRGDAAGRVGLALLDDGTAIVSWLQSGSNGKATLLLTPVTASGDVGDDYLVAADVTGFSVPQIVRDGDALLLVWTVKDNKSSSLAGARIALERII